METVHRPLRQRENILSSDVADALELLVARMNGNLPMAFDKADVVRMLIEIVHTDDDGTFNEPPLVVRRALDAQFYNRLSNTAVFQAGYKRFEKRTSLPVVPVTDFFFKHVFANGDTADCLDGMSPHEIKQSLPKRAGRVRDEDGGGADYLRGENGEVLTFGELAGIVIFPARFNCGLIHAWLQRRANTAVGQLEKTVDAIEHARPGTIAVERLKENRVAPTLRQALPKPKR